MPDFTVHLYREMRLQFNSVTADTAQQAAEIASGKATSEADGIEDCEGRDFSALVDAPGDEDGTVIDFPQAGIASHFAQAMQGILQAAVDRWGDAVRNDEPIDGGDAVQWLSGFIAAASPLVQAPPPQPQEGSTEYRVRWEIDVMADTPEQAAERALLTQRRPDSTANVFTVTEGPNMATVDLGDHPVYRP